ncbi:MAG: chorismate-binding protein [Propionibacteriales bacterium]|nr:chorismate-binding protein [Propionibacteriales bacterium]
MPKLHAHTVEIDDPGPLAPYLPRSAGTAWLRRGDGMIGIGEVARWQGRDIAEGEAWWQDFLGRVSVTTLDQVPGSGPIAFGTFCFDPDNTSARATMIIPELIIGRRGGRAWLTGLHSDPMHLPTMPGRSNGVAPAEVSWSDGSLNGPAWESMVASAVDSIRDGAVDKVVLARDVIAHAGVEVDHRWLVERLSREYDRCWTYSVDGLVGATPEMLIRREGGMATSRVLAGTIRRTGHDDHDLALAAALSQSSKDLAEHEFAVASVADRLAPYCSGMHVPDSPYVLELPNVLHLATDVTGVTIDTASSLALAGALHPSAAVCGTPTDAARALIAEVEHLDRGRYSGPVGWLDAHGDGEWGIALRCGQILSRDPTSIRLFAGCGIVADSDPEAELAESNAKLVPMRDALGT